MKRYLLIIFFTLILGFFIMVLEGLSIFYIAGTSTNPLISLSILLPLTSAIYIMSFMKVPTDYLLVGLFITSTVAAFGIVLLISYLLKLIKRT